MSRKKIVLIILFVLTDIFMIYNLLKSSSWEFYSDLQKVLYILFYNIVTALIYLILYLIVRSPIRTSASKLSIKVIDQNLMDKKDSAINIEKFGDFTFNRFKELEDASAKFDYETIRKITTDEFYNMRVMQLETSKIDGKIDALKNLELLDYGVVSIKIEKNIEIVNVAFLISFDEIEVGKTSNEIKRKSVIKEYIVTFIRTIETKENKCSSCGANFGLVASNACPYCKSVIISDSYAFVISKIVML